MSTPSPLQNQDNLAAASGPGSRVKITVLTIAALHVVVIGGLLLQGCDKKGGQTAGTPGSSPTNFVGSMPPLPDNRSTTTSPSDTGSGLAGGSATGAGLGSGLGPGPGAGSTGPSSPAPTSPPTSPSPAPSGNAADASAAPSKSGTGSIPSLIPSLPAAAPSNPASTETASHGSASPNPSGGSPSSPANTAAAVGSTGPTEHVIKSGDRIGELAAKYGVTTKAILDANPGVNPRALKVDAKLNIPAPTPKASAPAPKTSATAAGGGTGTKPAAGAPTAPAGDAADSYVVKQGDTLAKIAKKYGITVPQLRAANKLKGDHIVSKQRLSIPVKSVPASTPGAGDNSN